MNDDEDNGGSGSRRSGDDVTSAVASCTRSLTFTWLMFEDANELATLCVLLVESRPRRRLGGTRVRNTLVERLPLSVLLLV